ncbi:phenylalanine--tRNA ligase subunit beta [Enemella dayhoffiae]|uniref:Phenylalanine--tRNA ligase beta subunit n=1 Tax=Enemella dayhoffiae TaxID=2016507 RepID=A0A255H4J4_9ACTN|nr:phenylalanine--tRNA ligase subunit beta [Enemella dayhoffiae]OYO22123.1 phenylalanine--tRNA ligase subunit beta [Enemella dayhoffiae]
MKAPLSWLREFVELPADVDVPALREAFIRAGIEVEGVQAGTEVSGPVVVGRVLEVNPEPQKNGKTINWCTVDVGAHNPPDQPGRGIVCGAHNFGVGDHVVVSLPGAVLAGGFEIAARKTYGHVSDGMICSATELGLPEDGTDGIIVLEGDPQVGQPAMPLLGADEVIFELEITPDMPHCLSIRGLARELAQSFDVAFTDPVQEFGDPQQGSVGVRLADPRCSQFVALRVTGFDPTRSSPAWLKRRITQSGIRSISLAVDITNYVMVELGRPLHGYDADRLSGDIVVRAARAGETVTTLDDQVRTLGPDDLVITDDSGPIGLAGVMGGASTELSDQTRNVVIEGAYFDPATISRSSRGHKLPSEASRRFERGVDPAATYAGVLRAGQLLAELGGGTVDERVTVVGEVPPLPGCTLPVDLPEKILGMPVSADTVVEALTGAGIDVQRDGDQLRVTPPSWRPDLRDPYDYVEEVGQKVGLDRIVGLVPPAPGGRGLTAGQRGRRAVTTTLADLGLVEVLTFPFQATADLDRLGLGADDPRRAQVRLANPLAETSPFLRTTTLPGLLAAAARNLSRGLDDVAIFELGSVFRAGDGRPAPMPPVDRRPTDSEWAALNDAIPAQPRHLGVLLQGSWLPQRWDGAAEPVGWRHAMGIVDALARTLGVPVRRRAGQQAPFHPGRCAELVLDDVVVGHAGELHPNVVKEFGLSAGAAAIELDLDALLAALPGPGVIAPLSSYPVAKEDVALVVPADVAAADVQAALVRGAGELLESIRLFDIYTGDQIPEGRKSLAYALRFRAVGRTLKDAEAAQARDAAVAAARESCGAVLRS